MCLDCQASGSGVMLYLLVGEYTMEEPKRGLYVPTRRINSLSTARQLPIVPPRFARGG